MKRNALLLLHIVLCSGLCLADPSAVYSPVYVSPQNVAAAAAPQAPPAAVHVVQPTAVAQPAVNWLTQTVYGFLDFTTTIGNTVMVFSPQSAPPPAPAPASVVAAAPTVAVVKDVPKAVINTEPPTVVTASDIRPSKAAKSSAPAQLAEPAMSSVVHVVASQPDEKPAPKKPHIISSQVQVVVSADADAKPAPAILSSHVEVRSSQPSAVIAVMPAPAEPIAPVVSSVVEVLSSSSSEEQDSDASDASDDFEPVLQVENNLGEPEYDFLSRQPSEFAEETFRIHNIKPSQSARPKSRGPQASARAGQQQQQQQQPRADSLHPTGLVTKLGGTVVKDGATTVHETSVIGTYISGKYAQVLQSTSHIIQAAAPKPKIAPTASLRILKTAAPHIPKHHAKHAASATAPPPTAPDSLPIDEVYGSSPSTNLVRASRRPATASGSFKNRFQQRANGKEQAEQQQAAAPVEIQATPAYQQGGSKKSRINKNQKNRFANRPAEQSATVYSEPAHPTPANRRSSSSPSNAGKPSNRQGFKPTNAAPTTTASPPAAADRRFKPVKVVQASNVEADQSSSLYKFRLNRAPGRWQYKTSPKPRITIRKQAGDDAAQPVAPTPSYDAAAEKQRDSNDIQSPAPASAGGRQLDDTDLDSAPSINGDVLGDAETLENAIEHSKKEERVETLKVEISTPANFKDTYYEIATIKSPYTFQVGSVRNTRFITLTSTFTKTLDPEPTSTSVLTEPLTENILATTAHLDKEHNLLDSSIATLPPILLPSDQETPPLETLTETFSTTQMMLKTHILPVVREGGGNATSYTLIQTYHVTRLVTATKTLPPMEAYHFNPSKALKEFNSKLDEAGSELNLELDFGDDENDEDADTERRAALPADLDLSNVGLDFDLSQVDKSTIPEAHLRPKKKPATTATTTTALPLDMAALQFGQIPAGLSPEQLQQLALLRLYNPAAQLPAHLLQPSAVAPPVLTYETVYESHVIPIFNGVSTSFSTISRPVATRTHTEYPQMTAQLPQQFQLPTPPPQQHQLLQHPLQPQQFQITTAPIVTQTMVTEVQSKVLKLTFGAKTAYTTLFSTAVVPTILTTYITQSVPVQPTAAAFPGYFPGGFAPFPYVG